MLISKGLRFECEIWFDICPSLANNDFTVASPDWLRATPWVEYWEIHWTSQCKTNLRSKWYVNIRHNSLFCTCTVCAWWY